MLDMGCHGVEFARWMLGKPKIARVPCDLKLNKHADKTRGDDTSIVIAVRNQCGTADRFMEQRVAGNSCKRASELRALQLLKKPAIVRMRNLQAKCSTPGSEQTY